MTSPRWSSGTEARLRRFPRRLRALAIGWGLLGIALWNALFEMFVVRGVKDCLLQVGGAAAAGTPFTPIRDVMEPAIRHAALVASAWTAVLWLAAALTVHYASSHPRLEPGLRPGTPAGDAER